MHHCIKTVCCIPFFISFLFVKCFNLIFYSILYNYHLRFYVKFKKWNRTLYKHLNLRICYNNLILFRSSIQKRRKKEETVKYDIVILIWKYRFLVYLECKSCIDKVHIIISFQDLIKSLSFHMQSVFSVWKVVGYP